MFSVVTHPARCAVLLFALLTAALSPSSFLRGQTPAATPAPSTVSSSLDLAPADTAFYLATSSHRQLWQAITESRAYAALKESPAGRKMRKAYRKGLSRGWDQFGENPLRYYLEGYANSLDSVQGKVVLPYLERLLANELFIYADSKAVTFLNSFFAYYDELNTALLEAAEGEDSPELWQLIEGLGEKHLSQLEVPTIVVGAIADEPEVFVGFLELMNNGMQQALAQDPEQMQVLSRLVRYRSEGTTVADRLAWFGFEVDSDQLPWDELALVDPDLGTVLEAFEPLYTGKRFVLAFAVRGEVVLFTLAPSFDHLQKLGSGPLLVDQPQLKPLQEARASGRPLCFASYQSAEFVRLSQSTWDDLAKGAANLFNQIVAAGQSELLSESELLGLMESFRSEARQFASEMKAFESTPGARLSFGQLTPEGIEGFAYEFDQPAENGNTQPLRLPGQLRAAPLLAAFTRDQSTAEQWQIISKYASKLFTSLEEYGPLLAEDLEQAEISAIVLDQLTPLLRSLSETTFGRLLPQLTGEEWGLIVDLSIARSSWHAAMPPAATPLPLPGAVLMMSVKDTAAMQEVGSRYLEIARQALEDVKEIGGGEIPEALEIPDPTRTILAQGTQFSFPLPAEMGLTADWLPHAAINEQLLAIGYFPELTSRLLNPVAPGQSNGPAPTGRWFGPAAEQGGSTGLLFLDNQQLGNAVELWTRYGLEQAGAAGKSLGFDPEAESSDLNLSPEEVEATLAAGFNFYRCFGGYSSRTFHSGNQRVRHSLWQFSDLPR